MSTTEAKVVLSVVDHITAPLAGIQRRIDRITAPVRRITRALGDVGRAAGLDRINAAVGRIGSRMAMAAGHATTFLARLSAISGISLAGVGIGLKDLWKTNTSMETMRMRIGELFGKDRQKEVMDWAVAFDRVNPGGIEDIVENLTKLKAFGIDGTVGPLKALVDYNSKVGGNQERLKRIILAIGQMQTKGKIQGDEVLQLTEAGVPAMQLLARATGKTQEALEKLRSKGKLGPEYIRKLVAQMGKEADGAGEAYMKTAEGIEDKLRSTIQGFKLKIGDAGAFDFMKQKLEQFADWLNTLDADRAAKRISDAIISVGTAIETAIRGADWSKVFDQIQQGWEVVKRLGEGLEWLAEISGGPVKLALAGLAVFTLAPLVASVLSAIAAVATLTSILGTPVVAIGAAIAALAAGAALVYASWEPIKKLFTDIWAKLAETPTFKAWETVNSTFYDFGVQMIDSLWNGIQSTFPRVTAGIREEIAMLTSWMPDWLKGKLGLSEIGRSGPTAGASASWSPAGASGSWTDRSSQGDWGGRAWGPPMPGRSVAPAASTKSPVANGNVASAFDGLSRGGVPSVTQQTNVDVSAPLTVNPTINAANVDAAVAQIRGLLEALQAQTNAKIRAAAAAALSD